MGVLGSSSEVSGRERGLGERGRGEGSEGLGRVTAVSIYDFYDEVGIVASEVGCEDVGVCRRGVAVDFSNEVDQ